MNTLICDFSFQVTSWNIVCNKVISSEDWQRGESHWVNNVKNWENYLPKLPFLSPIKRRRLSESARLFFESAWTLTENDSNLPVVYASLNGEFNRSFTLWKTLLQEGDVSPTSFSLSVHNALIGQWSETRKVKNETTAITAQKDNIEIALMEAFCLLNEGEDKVLVVLSENPLDKKYNAYPVMRQPFSYALSMVIEKGSQYHISLHDKKFTEKSSEIDNALIWVKNQHLTTTQWQTPSSRGGYWQWQKN